MGDRFRGLITLGSLRDPCFGVIALADAGLAVVLIVLLWRRFRSVVLRTVLLLAFASYIAVPAYFTLMLG